MNNDPAHDHGFEGSSLRGVAQNLSDLLSHFNLSDGTDYSMDTLEKLEHFDQYYTQDDYNSATDGCDVLDAECHCAHSTYWAEREDFDCSEYPLVYWYHPDYLGNTEYITDMSGKAFQYFWHSPWGETWVNQHAGTGSYSSPYRFNAKEWDAETGNYYYGARYYPPSTSVWLSVDKKAHWYPQINPYGFTLNNPVNLIDPNGQWVKGAGFFRNLFNSDQKILAQMKAKRMGGRAFKIKKGVWRAAWETYEEGTVGTANFQDFSKGSGARSKSHLSNEGGGINFTTKNPGDLFGQHGERRRGYGPSRNIDGILPTAPRGLGSWWNSFRKGLDFWKIWDKGKSLNENMRDNSVIDTDVPTAKVLEEPKPTQDTTFEVNKEGKDGWWRPTDTTMSKSDERKLRRDDGIMPNIPYSE